MVYIIGASSLKASTEVAPNKLKRVLSRISFGTKGLSLNPKSIHNVLNLDFLLEKGSLRNKKEIMLWHDVLNNTITKHRLNNKKAETVPNLIKTLRKHSWRIKAIIYCQRKGRHEKYLRGSTKAGHSRNTSRKKANLQKETKRVVVPIQPPENPPLNYIGNRVP